jgi:hypothetical protein
MKRCDGGASRRILSAWRIFRENFEKSPLRFSLLGVYSYLSLVMSLTTTNETLN